MTTTTVALVVLLDGVCFFIHEQHGDGGPLSKAGTPRTPAFYRTNLTVYSSFTPPINHLQIDQDLDHLVGAKLPL